MASLTGFGMQHQPNTAQTNGVGQFVAKLEDNVKPHVKILEQPAENKLRFR